MTKTYRVTNLDCANCAAKLERALGKLCGVNCASVSFITQKIVLDIDEDAVETVDARVRAACKKIEPNMTLR